MTITKEDLINYFLNSSKPVEDAKVGIELELFLCNNNLSPFNKNDLSHLLSYFSEDNWKKLYLNSEIKYLKSQNCNVSFEPGLQMEFSSFPEKDLNLLFKSYTFFIKDLNIALQKMNGNHFAMGYHPILGPNNIPFLGGDRYNFMYEYMTKVGTLGRNMMKNTTTLQTNIDYHNKEDLQKKVQVLSNITPFLIYFSASSPFKEEKITPFLSYRNHIWDNTDKFRCGIPEFYFNQQFFIEKYIDYLINIPVYFIIRDSKFIFNKENYTFLDLMKNKVKDINLTLDDFILHLSTVFPDIRIKNYIEIRSCDTMGTNLPLAIPSLITGITYNTSSLDEIYALTKSWSKKTFLTLKNHLNTNGLTNEKICGVNLIGFATNLIEAAYNGLKARKLNEEHYLDPLKLILDSKTNLAQKYIEHFNTYKDIRTVTKYIIKTYNY